MGVHAMESNVDIGIEQANLSHITELCELMQAFYAESGYELDCGWAAQSFEMLCKHPNYGRIWLSRSEGRCVGYAVVTWRYAMEHGGLVGYIDDLFVRPDERKRGAGFALVKHLIQDCKQRGCKAVYVEVGETNAPAQSLYRKCKMAALADGRVLFRTVIV